MDGYGLKMNKRVRSIYHKLIKVSASHESVLISFHGFSIYSGYSSHISVCSGFG